MFEFLRGDELGGIDHAQREAAPIIQSTFGGIGDAPGSIPELAGLFDSQVFISFVLWQLVFCIRYPSRTGFTRFCSIS